MTREEQIEAIQAALVAIEKSIGEAQLALTQASTVDDVARLNNQIVRFKAKRTELQLKLLNLEAVGPEVAVAGARAAAAAAGPRAAFTAKETSRGRALTRELGKASADRQFVDAALKNSAAVSAQVDELIALLSGTGAGAGAGGRRAAKAAKARR
jgi:hypothetical protein